MRWYAGHLGRESVVARFEAALFRSDLWHRVPLTLTWVGDSLRWLLIVERLPAGTSWDWVWNEMRALWQRHQGRTELLTGPGADGPAVWRTASSAGENGPERAGMA
jgi:hypothetical protein